MLRIRLKKIYVPHNKDHEKEIRFNWWMIFFSLITAVVVVFLQLSWWQDFLLFGVLTVWNVCIAKRLSRRTFNGR